MCVGRQDLSDRNYFHRGTGNGHNLFFLLSLFTDPRTITVIMGYLSHTEMTLLTQDK